MYFDFEDDRPDTPRIPQPISRREVVLLTVNIHALVLIVILLAPKIPWVREAMERRQQEIEELARQQLERQREQPRFVFMQPRVDTPATRPPPRADLSDLDRQARTIERPPVPANPLPYSRGNSLERMEAEPAPTPTPVPAPPTPPNGHSEAAKSAVPLPELNAAERPADLHTQTESREPAVGAIADAIRNVRRYAQSEVFANPRGGQDAALGESIQFDSKGVDFGPWLARFIAQVRANWLPLIPQAAMVMRGHTSITFLVHRDGRITDVMVAKPSAVDAFTNAGRGAILTSNPTLPLPREYPDDRMVMTVTFYYNEQPPGR